MGENDKPRVLLVDDSLLVQRMIREYFEPAGYDVTVAGNGQEALAAVKESRPDVIISDIIMPVMDGWEFCEQIRSQKETSDIPFLFLTAVREVPKRIQGLRMGADDYVTKPFSREELLARVEVALAKMERLRVLQSEGKSLTGHTSHLSITDLLQLLSLNGKTGVLRLTDDSGQTGKVFFRDGKIVDASIGEVEGRKAIYRLLAWTDARFELDPAAEVPDRAVIRDATSNVMMEGVTHNDEMKRLAERLPSTSARFQIDPSLGDREDKSKMGTSEKAVLLEFQNGATFGEVLDRSPLKDIEVGRAVLNLIEKGFVRPETS